MRPHFTPPGTTILWTDLDPSDIAAIRTRTAMSQAQFAELLGVTPGTIAHWEHGRASPHQRTARKIMALIDHPNIEHLSLQQLAIIVREAKGPHLL